MIRHAWPLTVLLIASPAAAQIDATKQQCLQAYEKAQELRLEERLREAKEQLAICVAPACPEVASKDCAVWLGEVEAQQPTVRLVVSGGSDVRVTIDGVVVDSPFAGDVVVDPGRRVFVFTMAGRDPIVRRETIEAGKKGREISVTFPAVTPPVAPEPAPTIVPEPAPVAPPPTEPTVHPVAWVLYGVSAVGFGGFIGLGVHSLSQEECKPDCDDDQVDDIVVFRALADVSLGIGVLALGGAVWATVASLRAEETAFRLTPDGFAVSF